MPPAEWQQVRNLLAIRLDNIGDIVMLGPALRTLRQALPQARLTLMASPAGGQAAPLLPWVDDVMVHRAVWQDLGGGIPQSRERELALVDELQNRGFDAAVIFTSFSQSPWPAALVCHLAGIPIRLGQSREFGGSLLSQWVKPLPDAVHQVDRNLHLLEAAGFTPADRRLALHVPAAVQAAAERLLRGQEVDPAAPFIALAPGASCETRRYPPERFAAAASRLGLESGLPVVLLGGAREDHLARAIMEGGGRARIVSLVGQTSVPEMAGVLRRARLVLANNSGPLHISDAFARPMVVLYSGSEYESQWEPRGAPARLLRRPTACSPCHAITCPHGLECLDISPDEVVDAAMELLLKEHEPRDALDGPSAMQKDGRQYETS